MKLKIKNNKSISAIIITKDRPKYFLKAIRSVLNQSDKVNEIIVVDNGKKKLKFDFKKIKYIKTSYAIGSSRARNIGIKKSKSNYCAFFTTKATDDGRRTGELVEYSDTKTMFTNPSERLTEEYISGRFG